MPTTVSGAARAQRVPLRVEPFEIEDRRELRREIALVTIAFTALAALFWWATTVMAP